MIYLRDFESLIKRLLLLFITGLFAPLCTALTARGAPHAISLVAARTSDKHPLHATEDVTLWCAPDNPQVTITKASLQRSKDRKDFQMKLSANKKNATHLIEKPALHDAGEYLCNLDTPYGKLQTKLQLYVRPIVITTHDHFEPKEGEYVLEGEQIAKSQGAEFNLTCPITGYPVPTIKWTKDGKPLELSDQVVLDGTTVRVKNLDSNVTGVYSCEGVNEYSVGGKASRLQLVLSRKVDMKTAMAWIIPLLVIIIMLALLVLIIAFCEIRKKHQDTKNRYVTE